MLDGGRDTGVRARPIGRPDRGALASIHVQVTPRGIGGLERPDVRAVARPVREELIYEKLREYMRAAAAAASAEPEDVARLELAVKLARMEFLNALDAFQLGLLPAPPVDPPPPSARDTEE